MSMRNRILLVASLLLPVCAVQAQDTNAPFATLKENVSYAIGYSVGRNLQRQGYDIDPALIERGIRDLLQGNTPAMSEEQAQQALQSYQQQLFAKRQQEQQLEAARNRQVGQAWLSENAEKPGVVTTESGLQYKVLKKGEGESVSPGDTVRVHYRGTLIDGTEFDSSYTRGQPAQFKVTAVIRGWTEALQMMKVGDQWELFIPSSLAYGDRAQGDKIPPGSTLIFDVELLDVTKPQPITSDIIKVPSAEEMKKGAKIETIKASDLKRIEEEARKAKAQEEE